MKVISVVGTKKTGKTTLVTALVKSLKEHGRVGTIKNMAGHPVDRGDTRRHFEAGADIAVGLGDSQIKVTREGSLELALAELEASGMDFVIVEGFKSSRLPKIVLGDLEASNAVKRIRTLNLKDALLDELKSLVMNLEDYRQ